MAIFRPTSSSASRTAQASTVSRKSTLPPMMLQHSASGKEIFAMSAKPGRLHQGAIRLLRLVVVIRRLPALLRLSSLSTRHPLCYRGQRRGVQLGQELLDVILHDDHFVVSRRHESFTDGVLCQRQQRAIVTCYV